jgi:hypothetical protein
MKALYYLFCILFYQVSFALLTPFIMMLPNSFTGVNTRRSEHEEKKKEEAYWLDSRGMKCLLDVASATRLRQFARYHKSTLQE